MRSRQWAMMSSSVRLAPGDSGGPVFAWDGSDWGLAGIMIAQGQFLEQPGTETFEGNETYIVDLAVYRDEILEATAVPEPGWLLQIGVGLAFLATAGRRRMRP